MFQGDAYLISTHLPVVTPQHDWRRFWCISHQTCQVDRASFVDEQVRAPQNLSDGLWNKQKISMLLYVAAMKRDLSKTVSRIPKWWEGTVNISAVIYIHTVRHFPWWRTRSRNTARARNLIQSSTLDTASAETVNIPRMVNVRTLIIIQPLLTWSLRHIASLLTAHARADGEGKEELADKRHLAAADGWRCISPDLL